MKNTIWKWLTRKHPEGAILPTKLLVLKAILFPLQFIAWKLGTTYGYSWEDDTWLIGGLRYSGAAMQMLADSQGEVYRIVRRGDVVTLTRVEE